MLSDSFTSNWIFQILDIPNIEEIKAYKSSFYFPSQISESQTYIFGWLPGTRSVASFRSHARCACQNGHLACSPRPSIECSKHVWSQAFPIISSTCLISLWLLWPCAGFLDLPSFVQPSWVIWQKASLFASMRSVSLYHTYSWLYLSVAIREYIVKSAVSWFCCTLDCLCC